MLDFSSIQKVNTVSVGYHVLLEDIGHLVSKPLHLVTPVMKYLYAACTSERIRTCQSEQVKWDQNKQKQVIAWHWDKAENRFYEFI